MERCSSDVLVIACATPRFGPSPCEQGEVGRPSPPPAFVTQDQSTQDLKQHRLSTGLRHLCSADMPVAVSFQLLMQLPDQGTFLSFVRAHLELLHLILRQHSKLEKLAVNRSTGSTPLSSKASKLSQIQHSPNNRGAAARAKKQKIFPPESVISGQRNSLRPNGRKSLSRANGGNYCIPQTHSLVVSQLRIKLDWGVT